MFTSSTFESFCSKWGIVHRVSTAYNPRANKRAELAVKHAKRLIRGNTSQTGSLDTDKIVKALLIQRNTPCSITGLSPAQIVFGRQVRDPLPLQPNKFIPRKEWRLAAESREESHAKTRFTQQEKLTRSSKKLPPLKEGDHVFIQDQHGNNPKQWTKTGVVIEVGPHDSYQVSVDGSRTITKRNRQFLRKFVPSPPTQSPKPTTKPVVPVKPVVEPEPQHEPEPAPVTVAPPPPPETNVPFEPKVPPLVLRRDHDNWYIPPQPAPQLTPMYPSPYQPMYPPPYQSVPLPPSYLPLPPPPQSCYNSYMSMLPYTWSPHYQQ